MPRKTIKLSHRQNQIDHHSPSDATVPTLFLHGLDSSSHTWRSILDELTTPAAAIDFRGCGYSDLGDPDEFSPDAIVEDIHEFVSNHEYFRSNEKTKTTREEEGQEDGIKKFVICGHSMGGRIAMSYAAKYPQKILALIVEDMDIRVRPMSMNMFQRKIINRDETIQFNRNFNNLDSVEKMKDVYEKEGYPPNSVEKWIAEGRIVPKKGDELDINNNDLASSSYYSEVNPAFRLLCYEQFFITNHGESTWNQIASNTMYDFPCHIMVAGKEGTVCDNHSICQMQEIMNEKSKFRMILHRYKDATHSIHNSARKNFLSDLQTIVDVAQHSSRKG